MTRRINAYNGSLLEFIQLWDSDCAWPEKPIAIRQSPAGNINLNGSCEDHRADCLTPSHPQFLDCLEPGIKDLVHFLVSSWNLITYSSCEGHLYHQVALPPIPRCVGILPRNDSEKQEIMAVLNPSMASINERFDFTSIQVCLSELNLDADDGSRPCLELRFDLKEGGNWYQYFEQIEKVYQEFLAEILQAFPH